MAKTNANESIAGRRRKGVGDRLYSDLKEYVLNSPPKALVAPENELSQKYGISRVTTRRVMKRLSKEGLIFRSRGRGTFVAAHSANRTSRDTIVYCQWSRSFGHPFYGEMMRGALEQAEEEVVTLDIIPYRRLISDSIDAVLKAAAVATTIGLIGAFMSDEDYRMIRKANPRIKIAFTEMRPGRRCENSCSIWNDTREFGRLSGEYLIGLGVPGIAYAGLDQMVMSGLRDAAESTGTRIQMIRAPFNLTENDLSRIMSELLKRKGWGLVIGDDFLARIIFDTFLSRRQDPSEIFRIVSYANKGDRAALKNVTRVEFDGYEMGAKSVSLLKVLQENPVLDGLEVQLRPRLIAV